MANPKITYDIEANAKGAAEVEKLADELEKLDDAVDPSLAAKARAAAEALREIGRQNDAIDAFRRWKEATGQARAELDAAQAAAQKLASEMAASGEPTRAQSGRLEKLRDAVREAKQALQEQTAELDAARSKLGQYGIPLDGVAAKQRELRQSTESLRRELSGIAETANAASAFGPLVRDTDAARAKMEALARAADLYAGTIGQSGPPTAAQSENLRTMQAAASAAKAEFERLQNAVVEQANSLRQAGANTEQLTSSARELATAQRQAGAAAQQSGAQIAAASTQARTATDGVADSVARVGGGLRAVAAAAAAVVGGDLLAGTLGQVAQTADAYANLGARIKIVTGASGDFEQAFEGVFEVANRTSSSLESTGTLFARIAEAGKTLGVTQRDALLLTETINQAVQVSGASAASSDAALQQLIQALQSGVLRGEEFNSVMEQAPRLAVALADGLGVTTGELRKQAEAGALSSEVVIKALQGQAAVVAGEFAQLPPTVGRALTNLSTEWTRYVGEVDKANGISTAAASAINSLAGNLDTLGAVLFSAGKAAAAYTAVRLAATFLANAQAATAAAAAKTQETAATAANSAAQTANTTATTANTTAKRANAAAATAAGAAADGAVAGAGRLASIFATLRTFTLIGIVTNLQEIGTWLGESVAKWQGYGKAIEEAESKAKALEQAQREMAAQDAAIAQARQKATDATLGLNTQSKALLGTFEKIIKEGGTVSAALQAVAKDANLGNLKGIQDMSAALDALGQRGKINSAEIKGALTDALAGQDLLRFETQARAAFDTGEQGARRLGAALAAIDSEALRRAGTSVDQIRTGFNTATISAINDVDALASAVERLGVRNAETSRAVSSSLDKALEVASTEQAVQAVIDRLQSLGEQGLISGDQLTNGLDKARAKLDEITPGVNSLAEAARAAGVDIGTLTTGISKGFADSSTNIQTLAAQIDAAGLKAQAVGPVLAQALDQQVAAAKTEQEARAVVAQIEAIIAKSPQLAASLGDALESARAKAAELTPGINSLNEALATFGLKSQDQLQQTADNFRGAWEQIRGSVQVGIADKIKAFEQYRNAAAAANGGVVSGELRIQEEMLKSAAAARGVSTDLQGISTAALDAGQSGQQAGEQIAGSFNSAAQSIRQATQDVGSYSTAQRNAALSAESAASDAARKSINSTSVDAGGYFKLKDKLAAGTLGESDRALAEAVLAAEKNNSLLNASANPGAISFEGRRDAEARMANAVRALEQINAAKSAAEQATKRAADQAAADKAAKDAQAAQAKTSDSTRTGTTTSRIIEPASPSRTVTVNLTLGGASASVPTTESGAASLLALLEQAKSATGG